jgi:hypothetical protein
MHNVTECAHAAELGRVSMLLMDFAPGSQAHAKIVTLYMPLGRSAAPDRNPGEATRLVVHLGAPSRGLVNGNA